MQASTDGAADVEQPHPSPLTRIAAGDGAAQERQGLDAPALQRLSKQVQKLFTAYGTGADGSLLDVDGITEALLASAQASYVYLAPHQARHAALALASAAAASSASSATSSSSSSSCDGGPSQRSSLMSSRQDCGGDGHGHALPPRSGASLGDPTASMHAATPPPPPPVSKEALLRLMAVLCTPDATHPSPAAAAPSSCPGAVAAAPDGQLGVCVPPSEPQQAQQQQQASWWRSAAAGGLFWKRSGTVAHAAGGANGGGGSGGGGGGGGAWGLQLPRWVWDTLWFAGTPRGCFTIQLCAAMVGMFVWGFVVHLHGLEFAVMGYAWPVARACAYVIRLSMAFMLFFVCARFLTFLRATPLRHVIPLDHAIGLHMLLGYVFFAAAMGHVLCHFIGHTLMLTSSPKYQAAGLPAPTMVEVWVNWPTVSGLLMFTIVLTFYAWAVPSIRRSPLLRGTSVGRVLSNYNTFHQTHQVLWVSMVLLALLHPLPNKPKVPHTSRLWLFIAFPFVLLLVERAYRAWVRGQRVEVVSIRALPGHLPLSAAGPGSGAAAAGGGGGSGGGGGGGGGGAGGGGQGHQAAPGVTQLVLRVSDAPYTFRHKAGQYLHLQCEEVSKKQWHPFTITSAPDDELLTVHAAVQGDWTEKLYALALSVDATSTTNKANSGGAITAGRACPPSISSGSPMCTATAAVACAGGHHPHHHHHRHHSLDTTLSANSASGSNALLSLNESGPITIKNPLQLLTSEEHVGEEHVGHDQPRSLALSGQSSSEGAGAGALSALRKAPAPAPAHAQPTSSSGAPAGRLSPRTFLSMRSGLLPCTGVAKPHFRVDGPYGAPTQHFMEHEVLVLVAGGIGVTPMVAILRHIMHQLASRQCAQCNMVHLDSSFWLRRLYLHFIFRQQGMLQWFRPTFEGVTRLAPPGLCDTHFHYTGATPGADCALLELAQRVEEQQDLCMLADANIRARTCFGRPDLRRIVDQVAAAHPDARVGVLFCGAPHMGDLLEQAARESGHGRIRVVREVFGS